MRLWIWPALVVLLSLASHVAFVQALHRQDPQEFSPVAVQPGQFASDPSVRAYFAELLRLAGGGYRSMERAAFLVAAGRGGYRCLLWPYHTGFQREVFRGRIPPGTIAVVHTHPNAIPRPSPGDRLESRRLGLPFIVVSARHIYAVTGNGEVAAVVENEWWSDGTERRQAGGCEPLTEAADSAIGMDLRRHDTELREAGPVSSRVAGQQRVAGNRRVRPDVEIR